MMGSLAIHAGRGFSPRWLERAAALGLAYEAVDCHGSGIVDLLRRHAGLLYHWSHLRWADLLIGRAVIRSAETLGMHVFPSTDTCWTFDDKLAQKYQLEAVGAPLPQIDCFFSEEEALAWIDGATFPRVFKLRRGAGSQNVVLVRSRADAQRYVRRAFRSGFPALGTPLADAGRFVRKARARRDLLGPILRLPRTLLTNRRKARELGVEHGYVYAQEFLPGNAFDVRVTVIGRRAFSFSRNVRPNDFRASGSGSIDYSPERVRPECLKIAFDVTRKLRSQSAAFDFAFDARGAPKILEVSYCYKAEAVHDCPGHWDEALRFHPGHVWPQDAILEDLLDDMERSPRGERERLPAPGRAAEGSSGS